MATTYDIALIGTGPGGYVAAIRASQLGLKVAVVEAEELGGTCLNWGCIPTKALLKNASVLHTIKHSDQFGITVEGIKPDFSKAVDRSKSVVKKQTTGLAFLMKKNKIDVFKGRGKLVAPGRISVSTGEEVSAKHVIIATGARPRLLPGLTADGKVVLTAREAVDFRSVPSKMIILGGGAIGCEFAYVFQNYGAQVTIVEMADHLLPKEDPEVAAVLEKAYKKLGIEVLTGHKVESVEQKPDGVKVKLSSKAGMKDLDAPAMIVGIGMAPNVEGLGLEAVGVKTERGAIVVDDFGRTNVKGVYAIGDVTGKVMLAHVASAMGIACVETIAGHQTQPINWDRIPACTYSEPQVASIGLTEAEAKKRGFDVKIGKFPFAPNGKAQALGDAEGFVKVVVDAKYGEVLGAHMVGPEVTELLSEVGLGMTLETTAQEIDLTIHAHPTLSEVVKEAALAAIGQPIHM
ncbi:MAG TPA: dihydrolipoyl dehydrogenase [Pantanalinema sp.]